MVNASLFTHIDGLNNVHLHEYRYNDESLFESAVNVCPNSAKMQQQLGQVRLNQGRTDEALRLFSLSQQIDPKFCDVKFNIASALVEKKDFGGAVANLRESLNCTYTTRRAWENLGQIWQLGIQLNPRNATLYQEMADTMATMGGHHVETATLYYREAGVLLMKRENMLTDSLIMFRKGLKLRPERCDLNYWSAIAYQKRLQKRGYKKIWQDKMIRFFRLAMKPHCNDTALNSANELLGVFDKKDYVRVAGILDHLIVARPDVKSSYARTASTYWEEAARSVLSDSQDMSRAARYYSNSIKYGISFSSCSSFKAASVLSSSSSKDSGITFEVNGKILNAKSLASMAQQCEHGVV